MLSIQVFYNTDNQKNYLNARTLVLFMVPRESPQSREKRTVMAKIADGEWDTWSSHEFHKKIKDIC